MNNFERDGGLLVPSNRRGFLVAGASALLAGCSGGASRLLAADPQTRNAECNVYQSVARSVHSENRQPNCNKVAITGGVDPTAWANFQQYSDDHVYSVGWNSASAFSHGANANSSSVLYTGNYNASLSGDGNTATITHSVNIPNGPSVTGSGGIATSVGSDGTIATSWGSMNSPAGDSGLSTQKVCQGVPCLISLEPTDSTQQNYTLSYKNLSSGYVWSMPVHFRTPLGTSSAERAMMSGLRHPDKMSCLIYDGAALFVGAVAIVLTFIALPEVIAGAAYAAAVGATVNGLSIAGWFCGFASFVRFRCY